MCRLLAFLGKSTRLSELVMEPRHSIVKQSFKAKERTEPLNGDGFGVGWYTPKLSDEPGLFTSVTPAWGNRNLQRIASKIESSCIFAHVRAASEGLLISELNCHPFQYRNLMWMHNGFIPAFNKIKRRLRRFLDDHLYDWLKGSTDSEHAFALLLHFLPKDVEGCNAQDWKSAMLKMIMQLEEWSREVGEKEPITANFALTDGSAILMCRYVSREGAKAESLYYIRGDYFECIGGKGYMRDEEKGQINSTIIASEPLTEDTKGWEPIPTNHCVIIEKDQSMQMFAI